MNNKEFWQWLAQRYGVKIKDFDKTKLPWFWKKFSSANAFAYKGETVYVRNLKNVSTTTLDILMCHEICRHIVKQRKIGWLWFLINYARKSFRASEETNGYIKTMEARYMYGLDIDRDPAKYAKIIRDKYFVGYRQYKIAFRRLEKAKHKIYKGTINDIRQLYTQYTQIIYTCN